MFKEIVFKDKVVVVSGGGSGIGFSIAENFAKSGAKVVIVGRKEDKLQQALSKVNLPDQVTSYSLDIRDNEKVVGLCDHLAALHGRVDVLVNNAGGQFPSMAETISPNGWSAVIGTNLTGTWQMTQNFANRFFIPQQSGSVINIIANIFRGFPGMAHTGAARAGVDNLTKTLAVEWSPHNIRINSIAPGIILSTGLDQYPPDLLKGISSKIPMKRLGTTDEIAWLALFLASPFAGYITGETIYADGGQRLWGDIWEIPDKR